MEKVITFEFERETKNAVRFKETSTPPVVGTLYVQKWFLQEEYKKHANAWPSLEVLIKTT